MFITIKPYRKFYTLSDLIKKNYFNTVVLKRVLEFLSDYEDDIFFIRYKGMYIMRPTDYSMYNHLDSVEEFEEFTEDFYDWNSVMADEYYSFLMCNYDVSKYHEGYYKLEIDDLFMYTEFISSKEKCYFNKLKEQQKWYILNYKEKK